MCTSEIFVNKIKIIKKTNFQTEKNISIFNSFFIKIFLIEIFEINYHKIYQKQYHEIK